MIKAIILDFDDTLCLTEEICFNLENDVLEEMGLPRMQREIHLQTWGQPLFEIIGTRSPGVDVEEFKRIYAKVLQRYNEEGLFDSIPKENLDAINELAREGKYIAIVTSRTEGEVAHLIEDTHPLAEAVQGFYHKDNTEFHKPDPRAFKEVLEDNNLLGEECIYVGDSLGDAESSIGAGMKFVASLESGLRQRDDFTELGIQYFITDFPQLLDAVDSIEKEEEKDPETELVKEVDVQPEEPIHETYLPHGRMG